MASIRKTLALRLAAPSLLQRRLLVPSASPCPLPRFPFLQKRPFYHPATISSSESAAMQYFTDERLAERIRELNPTRINLDDLAPPRRPPENSNGISVSEVRKVLWASRMEAVRERLREFPVSCVGYDEFVSLCEGDELIAKSLDDSSDVIVVNDFVFLRPQECLTGLD